MGDIFVTFFLGKQKRFSVQFVCFFFFFRQISLLSIPAFVVWLIPSFGYSENAKCVVNFSIVTLV